MCDRDATITGMAALRVTLEACVDGNPLKAWRDGTDPDDVWEPQTHDFDQLAAARSFIVGLHPQTSTHVELHVIDGADTLVVYRQDAGDDLTAVEQLLGNLDDVDLEQVKALLEREEAPLADAAVPAPPPLVARQGRGGRK